MSWNYRVIRDEHGALAIHEVYYTKDGMPNSWSCDPSPVYGEDLEEVRWGLDMMAGALKKPVLYIKDEKLYEDKDSEGS